MTCVRFRLADGTSGIMSLADECDPFLHNGNWYVVNERWGPIATTKLGDPLKHQPSGRKLQAAFDFYRSVTAAKVDG